MSELRKWLTSHGQAKLGRLGADQGRVRLPTDPVQNDDERHDHGAIHARLDDEAEHVISKRQRIRLLPRYPGHFLAVAVADLAASPPEAALDPEAGAA